jgi:hypothetical protein
MRCGTCGQTSIGGICGCFYPASTRDERAPRIPDTDPCEDKPNGCNSRPLSAPCTSCSKAQACRNCAHSAYGQRVGFICVEGGRVKDLSGPNLSPDEGRNCKQFKHWRDEE